ncbi:zinc finger protein CONSTANS-LIKE 15-like [Pyrus ussuriensis x Pyrus communis]|uniref:Zinc finger protein CONSTANS-LIKE 15-like n=1 Tax=Pyrus ussuriensis x Pyrus communis TaxID=2448454 RepID=A0A5N5FNQ1_9ROSA|nr:zinc finger protein CONSTANS-LIKE 15-like [Pyrus ussuriensis x Pyrus communis]
MRDCQLYGVRARVHCEPDQARLCWDCDGKVHRANFLVAKHPRSLLCRGCQSPTPWTGSGPKVTPTVSVCQICVERPGSNFEGRAEVQESEAESEGVDGEEEEDDGDDCDESDEDENQVVPLSCCSYSEADPPRTASCSSSEEEEEEEFSVSKRMREKADEGSGLGCDEMKAFGSLRMLKRRRLGGENRLQSKRSTAMGSSKSKGLLMETEAIYEDDDHDESR